MSAHCVIHNIFNSKQINFVRYYPCFTDEQTKSYKGYMIDPSYVVTNYGSRNWYFFPLQFAEERQNDSSIH